jgi:uncharacterized membrane protein
MRIVAIIMNVICLVYAGSILVNDIREIYFGEVGFYFLICLCFIINLIALARRRIKPSKKVKEQIEKEGAEG